MTISFPRSIPMFLGILLAPSRHGITRSFSVHAPFHHLAGHSTLASNSRLFFSAPNEAMTEISTMKAGEIKKELESYGISTKAFFEKKELVDALQKARDEGLTPKVSSNAQQSTTTTRATTTTTTPSSSTSTSTSSDSSKTSASRKERLQEEIANCKAMRAGELKKELEERGVSTKALFEKSELVQELAEARVDGVQRNSSPSSNGDAGGEGYAEYTNVEVVTDGAGPQKRSQQEQKQQQQQQQQSAGNPFGGGSPSGGGMPGGMGGMGGIADMLKNIGGGAGGGNPGTGGMPGGIGGIADMLKNMGGGAGGGNPFGGMGGMGGMGDAMSKAQGMMKNPKIMELMTKAQSNPKMMSILNECMSNPAAIKKYENDPEVKDLITELKKVM